MPKTKAKGRAEYVFQKIPKSLIDEVDKLVGLQGYRSRSEFIKDAIRNLLRDYNQILTVPRFVHTNTYEDHATIRDNSNGREINVYFKEGGVAYCGYCKEQSCEHIDYALTLPKVTEPLKERGWKRKS